MESPQSSFRDLVVRTVVYQNAMFAFCVVFGLALVADTHLSGDGLWIWYAELMRSGHHLYSDMHLPLQPLFVLETSWFLALLGPGWLASKVPAVLHVLLYSIGLLVIVRRSGMPNGQKAIVLGCAFFLSICSPLYRFDDYHVLADSFDLWSIVLLLALYRQASPERVVWLVAGLGALSGLAIVNRLNDGAALLASAGMGILCLVPAKRLAALLAFVAIAALAVVVIVLMTGDSLHDYAANAIFGAAGSKGGSAHVLLYPLHLPVNTWRFLRNGIYRHMLGYGFLLAGAWSFLLSPLRPGSRPIEWAKAALGATLIVAALYGMRRGLPDSVLIVALAGLGVFALYAAGALVLVRFLRWQWGAEETGAWDRREILYLIPLGLMVSLSTSSAGVHTGLYSPLALLILLLTIVSPVRLNLHWPRQFLLALAVLLLCNAAFYKARFPYVWHSYQSLPLFAGRQWYQHPDYGPMIVARDQLRFIEPVCDEIHSNGAQNELLSLPYPYANYFCSIPPWHGYVQTFFDTSSKETILELMNDLQSSPPKWILYERQLDSLRVHEIAYNGGQPLQHRYLDEMIEQKLAAGDWQAVYRSRYGDSTQWSNEWILIQTRP